MPNRFEHVKAMLSAWLVLLFVAACGSVGTPIVTPAPQSTATPTALPPGFTVSGRVRGDPNAKITLVEYGDFQ